MFFFTLWGFWSVGPGRLEHPPASREAGSPLPFPASLDPESQETKKTSKKNKTAKKHNFVFCFFGFPGRWIQGGWLTLALASLPGSRVPGNPKNPKNKKKQKKNQNILDFLAFFCFLAFFGFLGFLGLWIQGGWER